MELIFPFVLLIGIPAVIILCVLKLKRNDDYKNGKKIANTKYIKSIPYYKEVLGKYKKLVFSIKCICILSIISSLVLLSRPAKVDTTDPKNYARDIMLCMDASGSMDELNKSLVEKLKKTVSNLKGERFGISIFNTSSVLLVPLTDDYDYVIDVLDKLQEGFEESLSYDYDYDFDFNDESFLSREYIMSGTLVGNEVRGSSLIGDGLATCVTNFSNLDEERTRIIIFSTDNDLAGTEIVTLPEAAEICADNKITVFGIGPDEISGQAKEKELKSAVEKTGGNYYSANSSNTVSDIVEKIERKGKSLIKGQKETLRTDMPQVPFIILILSTGILFLLNKKVNV